MRTKSVDTKLLFSLLAASAVAGGGYRRQAFAAEVLVIDQGADLSHDGLANFQHRLPAGCDGATGRDHFSPACMGWNVISDDPNFMPPKIKKFFVDHSKEVAQVFDLFQRATDGDADAKREIRSNPNIYTIGQALLELSHGTHVAGIIAKNSGASAKIQNTNVFVGGNASVEEVVNGAPTDGISLNRLRAVSGATAFAPGYRHPMEVQIWEAAATEAPKSASFFDDRAQIDALLAKLGASEQNRSKLLDNYIRYAKPKVVNLSLGSSVISMQQTLENIWSSELTKAKKPPQTSRTETQQANFERLVDGLYGIEKDSWYNVFASNSDVLFVVAAGNDGSDKKVQDAGNNDIHPVQPANASADFPNVIAVAATDDRGALLDFSNYSPTLVSVGAPGHNILSYAPGNLTAVMSGTSMAAPYVTGVAAYMRTVNPNLSARDVRAIIEGTARKTESLDRKTSSGGMIDPAAAVRAAQGQNLPDRNSDDGFGGGGRNEKFPQRGSILPGFSMQMPDLTSAHELVPTSDFAKEMARSLF